MPLERAAAAPRATGRGIRLPPTPAATQPWIAKPVPPGLLRIASAIEEKGFMHSCEARQDFVDEVTMPTRTPTCSRPNGRTWRPV